MKKYLTRDQYQSLQSRIAAGRAHLIISRRVSRQFFTRVDNPSIVATTSQSMLGRKMIVWGGTIASPALLIICIASVIHYFGWFAAIAVPLVGMFWTIIAGLTGDKGTWWHGIIGLAAGLIFAALVDVDYGIPLALFSVSVWVHRAVYRLAQIWLTDLVSTSFGAFDMLVEHIDIRDPVLEAEQTPS